MTPRVAKLSALLAASHVVPAAFEGADPEIRGASLDSRRIEPGNLFIALRGLHEDGVRFAADAVRHGAPAVLAGSPRPASLEPRVGWVQLRDPRREAALVARECYDRPDEAVCLVGVTGTNGKTTVTWFLESIVRAAGCSAGRIGTTGYAWDGRADSAEHTTPEAPDLYRLLDRMRDAGVEVVAMEVSSHALALSRVAGARFEVAAFLNLGRDHLDFHPDLESYFAAKARLFEGLAPDAHAVLPHGSPWSERLRERCVARISTFGRSAGADVRLLDERSTLEGSTARLATPAGEIELHTKLPGRFNLDNAAAAAACALAAGLPIEAIATGIASLRSVAGRMESVRGGQPFTVLVDFAHTAEALAALLDAVREAGAARLLVVFGCGGSRDPHKRPAMGRAAAERADLLFLTSDNPRDEDPDRILDALEAGVREAGALTRSRRQPDRREAIREAVAAARPGDAVVIAGKGHETVQVVGRERRTFDDRAVAAEALAELGYEDGDGALA